MGEVIVFESPFGGSLFFNVICVFLTIRTLCHGGGWEGKSHVKKKREYRCLLSRADPWEPSMGMEVKSLPRDTGMEKEKADHKKDVNTSPVRIKPPLMCQRILRVC